MMELKQRIGIALCCALLLGLLCGCKKEIKSTLPDPDTLTYEQYIALDGKTQQAFMESFDSVEDFVAWYNAVQKAYFDSLPEAPVG